ncbi:MAG: hypothetical protein D3910_20570 [Candidatus Electrothrix sp. ATG2]|nr:hypothetical protein [Candidatus Electrothrix sp. ATG2]
MYGINNRESIKQMPRPQGTGFEQRISREGSSGLSARLQGRASLYRSLTGGLEYQCGMESIIFLGGFYRSTVKRFRLTL